MFIGKSVFIGVLSVLFNIIIQNMKNPDYSIIDIRSFYKSVKGKTLNEAFDKCSDCNKES